MAVLQWQDEDLRLLEHARAEMEAKIVAVDALVHFGEVTWSVDQDQRVITFDRQDGIRMVAPVQVIGTFNTTDGTWLWAWDNPSIVEHLTRDAETVRSYGEERNIAFLTTPKLKCEESDCLAFTALACKLSDSQGAYSGKIAGTLVYMTFGHLQMFARQRDEKGGLSGSGRY